MARKNENKGDSNKISFDTRTKTVMADVSQVNIKEKGLTLTSIKQEFIGLPSYEIKESMFKVSAVREVVSGKSNNEIVLVLQYYDNDVERVIQAFLEDGAKEALTEWHTSGSKPVKKKRNKKKAPPPQPQNENSHSPVSVSSESGSTTSLLMNGDVKEHVVNGGPYFSVDEHKETSIPNGRLSPVQSDITNRQTDAMKDCLDNPTMSHPHVPTLASDTAVSVAKQDVKEKSPSPLQQRQHHDRKNHGISGSHNTTHNRLRTTSNSSTGADNKKNGKKLTHHVLERSAKDLHRQTVSLERLRLVFSDEVDKSYKRIKAVFDEIKNCLNKREEELLGEMNSVKSIGRDTFTMRQGHAADLKVKIDRAEKMTEVELADLRSEIKHFVSDRKIDEDLGRTTRFLYADDALKADIAKFGEVIPVKCMYIQRHPSQSSLDSGAPSEPEPLSQSFRLDQKVKEEKPKDVISHLDPAETHEVAELQKRLKHSLTLEGIPVETFPDRPVSMPLPETSSNTASTSNRRPVTGSGRNNTRRRGGGPSNNSDRRDRNDNGGPNYSRGFIQGADGERIILIGKGTRPQSGPGRPYRGRRGGPRGRGGFRNEGRQGSGDATSSNTGTNNQGEKVTNQSPKSPDNRNDGKGPKPRRDNRKPREKSGSPRKQGVRSLSNVEGKGASNPAGLDGKVESRLSDTITSQ